MATIPEYTCSAANGLPADLADRNDPAWAGAPAGSIDHFFAKGSDHRPQTTFRVVWTQEYIWVQYAVEDRYVLSISRKYQDPVWQDSCVEFFIKPRADRGYFNFEFSAGGQLVLLYITDPEPQQNLFKEFVRVPWDLAQAVKIKSSLPPVIEPEIAEPVRWTLGAGIPVALMEYYVGPVRPLAGQKWNVNFYKCGDRTSHPHWGAWSPISGRESFHQPAFFGNLVFK